METSKIRINWQLHLFQIIVSLVTGFIGLIIGVVLTYGTRAVSGNAKIMIDVFFYFLFFALGLIGAELVVLVEARNTIEGIQSSIGGVQGSLELIRQERSVLPGVNKAVHEVLQRYSKRFWGDIASVPMKVHVMDYLRLLEESLAVASKSIFATSLISPQKWISDNNYTNYLKKQVTRKKQVASLVIQRIFIMDAKDFYLDPKVEEVIKLHIDGGIRIGLCDKSKIATDDNVDRVVFESNGNTWVVEGGVLPKDLASGDYKENVNMRFFFEEYSLQQLLEHWRSNIDPHIKIYDDIAAFRSSRTSFESQGK